MTVNTSRIIEGTIAAILFFWVIRNTDAVNSIATAAGKTLVGSTRALWGGGNPNK